MIRRILTLLICFAAICKVSAQEIDMMLKGGVEQQNYFTVVPYTSVGGLPIIKVEINGKEYRFLFDTGAGTAISQKLFVELAPEILTKLPLRDAEGRADTHEVCKIDEIKIGEVVFKDIPTWVLKDSPFVKCFELDGIVGSNQLRESIVRISDKEKTITITDMPDKLNLHNKQEYAMELFLEPYHNSPYIKTLIEDKKNFELQLLFDTGMNGMLDIALDHLNLLKKHKIISGKIEQSEGSDGHGFLGKASKSVQYRFRVPLYRINHNASLLNVEFSTTTNVNSRIGMKLLQYGDMTLDYKNKACFYEPHTAVDPDVYEKRQPISPVMDDGKMVVGIIWDKKLKKQISVGDQIISFNGTSLENLSECELFLYDFTPLKKEINTLEIKDKDGNIKEIEMREE